MTSKRNTPNSLYLYLTEIKKALYLHHLSGKKAEIAQLVEHDLAKVRVAGSSPVFRSFLCTKFRHFIRLPGWRNW